MSISKFPGHMRSTKLNFSATVLTLSWKTKGFRNLRLNSYKALWNNACAMRTDDNDLAKVLAGTAHAPHV